MTKKTLKVSLAMGGGVSLGSFSGAALTEALKLLIVETTKEGAEYTEVVVDSMSGASAGAISLGILLRSLIDYKSMLRLIAKSEKETNEAILNRLNQSLQEQYFSGKAIPTAEIKEQLIALEVAQILQEKIWVEELQAKELFGDKVKGKYKPDQDSAYGLLDRTVLEDLSKKYILGSNIGKNAPRLINTKNIQVLSKKRCLFACSLTNLIPLPSNDVYTAYRKAEAKLGINDIKQVLNLIKSTASYNHTEVRVIDFLFGESKIDESDARWLKFKEGKIENPPNNKAAPIFDIKGKKSWATLTASVLACGAFPIAFEPVLLKRYRGEYSEGVQADVFDQRGTTKVNDFLDEKKGLYGNNDQLLDTNSINVPYVDGGTFNNEPIKEAFRLANFIDYNDTSENVERIVLFVDPIVAKDNPSFRMSMYNPIKKEGNNFEEVSEFDKLISTVSPLVGMLRSQGSIKEEHKTDDYLQNLELSQTIKKYLISSKIELTPALTNVLRTAIEKLESLLKGRLISIGTRKVNTFLINEIQKKNKENLNSKDNKDKVIIPKSSLKVFVKNLLEIIKNKDTVLVEKFLCKEFLTEATKAAAKELETKEERENRKRQEEREQKPIQQLIKIILDLMIDVSLDVLGKNENATRIAIMPIHFETKEIIKLPGVEVQAFGGFVNKQARRYAFLYGRLCAILCLESKDFQLYHQFFTGKETNIDKLKKSIKPYVNSKNTDGVKELVTNTLLGLEFYSNKNLKKFAKDFENELVKNAIERVVSLFNVDHNFFREFYSKAFLFIKDADTLIDKLILKAAYIPITIRIKIKSNVENEIHLLSSRNYIEEVNEDYRYPMIEAEKDKVNDFLIFKGYIFYLENRNKVKSKKFRLTTVSHYDREIPNNSDPNLATLFRDGSHQIESMKLSNGKVINFTPLYDNKSIQFAMINITKYINPVLEFTEDNNWIFRENTISLHEELLESNA